MGCVFSFHAGKERMIEVKEFWELLRDICEFWGTLVLFVLAILGFTYLLIASLCLLLDFLVDIGILAIN